MSEATEYRPGVCNIGTRERRRRYAVAAAAFAVAAGYAAWLAVERPPAPLVLGLFAALAVGCEYCIQGYTSFCVRLAATGRYDLGPAGDAGAVERAPNRRADRRQAVRVTLVAQAVAVATTAVATVLLYG